MATEGRTDEERKAMSAARALKNYEMSFERHLNHQGALDAAIKDLSSQVVLHTRELPFVFFTCYDTLGGSQGEAFNG